MASATVIVFSASSFARCGSDPNSLALLAIDSLTVQGFHGTLLDSGDSAAQPTSSDRAPRRGTPRVRLAQGARTPNSVRICQLTRQTSYPGLAAAAVEASEPIAVRARAPICRTSFKEIPI